MLCICTVVTTSWLLGSRCARKAVFGTVALPYRRASHHRSAPGCPSIDQNVAKRSKQCLSFTKRCPTAGECRLNSAVLPAGARRPEHPLAWTLRSAYPDRGCNLSCCIRQGGWYAFASN
jgi:hypothetical protein